MEIQLEKMCRTCLAESKTLIPILAIDDTVSKDNDSSLEPPSLALILETLTKSDASIDDELPKKMCSNCISDMNQAFAFIQKCERSEKTLRSLLEQKKYTENKLNPPEIPFDGVSLPKNSQYCSNYFSNDESWEIQQQIEIIAEEIQPDEQAQTLQLDNKSNATKRFVEEFIAENSFKFNCNYCKATFSSRRSLNLHTNSRKCLKKSYECDICQRVFIKKRYLLRHLQRMHQMTNENHKTSKDDEATLHKKRKYKCHVCPKIFTMASSLNVHLRIHTGEKPYLCSICGKGFNQNSNLKQHLMRHNKNKPFKCNKCSANFVSKGELVTHNRTHTGDHPFTCEACNSGFTTSSSLVKHRRIHSGERPYQCDFCPLRFTALGTMKNHRRTHTGEKPFQCGICSKSFSQRTDCVSHLRTHSANTSFIMFQNCPNTNLPTEDT